ncbi:zinc transporter ZIP9-like isoform X2 [Myripristis murdjan]|uniref:zinc transporter ZIP9-like isoform X2 n=1 Tax=Myripristis murdjan TaxID=586833 RepID=UPI001175E495|nr:zinc transporter ZIP9-like isoform X2 [Myripristis murdjan]
MDGMSTITIIAVAMFVGCLIFGFIPLWIPLSEVKLKFVTLLGAGLLCGTALALIIPEGVHMMEESWRAPASSNASARHSPNASARHSPNVSEVQETPSETSYPPRVCIGVALVVGFTFMFVVDQIGTYLSMRLSRTDLPHSTSITTTLGLQFHSAADGIALGAAMATPEKTAHVMVFFAVILHKAPTAFGLVSFLMHAGLGRKCIQVHLLCFSAVAPLFAICTYVILHMGEASGLGFSLTGLGMLFSAGTFLYVATVHVLPQVSSKGQQQPPPPFQEHSGAEVQQHKHLGFLESLTFVLGAGLPLLGLALIDD